MRKKGDAREGPELGVCYSLAGAFPGHLALASSLAPFFLLQGGAWAVGKTLIGLTL